MRKIIITAMLVFGMLSLSDVAVQAQSSSQNKEPVLLGDVDENGSIELKDASALLKMALNLSVTPDDKIFYFDLDDDGQIGIEDAKRILKISLNLEPVLFCRNVEVQNIYSGMGIYGKEGSIAAETTRAAVSVLENYNVTQAACEVANLQEKQVEGKKIIMDFQSVYPVSGSIEVSDSFLWKESLPYLTDSFEYSTQIKGSGEPKQYVRVFLVDDTVNVQGIQNQVTVHSMGELMELPKDSQLLYHMEEQMVITEYAEYEKICQTGQLDMGLTEAFFEKNALLLFKTELFYEYGFEELEMNTQEDKLVIHFRRISGIVEDKTEKRKGVFKGDDHIYALTLPKTMLDGKTVQIEVEEQDKYNFCKAEDYQILSLGGPMGEAMIYTKFMQQESGAGGNLPTMIDFMNLTPEDKKLIEETAQEYNLDEHDVLIVPFSFKSVFVPYLDMEDGTLSVSLSVGEYGKYYSLLFSYGEGEKMKMYEKGTWYSDNRVLFLPIRKRNIIWNEKQI